MRSLSKIGSLSLCVVLLSWSVPLFAQPDEKKPQKLKVPDKKAEEKAKQIVLEVFGEDFKRVPETEALAKKAATEVKPKKLALDQALAAKKPVEAKILENKLAEHKKEAED